MIKNKLGRRQFLKAGGSVGALLGATVIPIHAAQAAALPAHVSNAGSTTLSYPRQALGRTQGMNVQQSRAFHYPDPASPCHLIRLDHGVPGGVGPNQDIVAYSAMCTHMGCPVAYDAANQTLKCGCHFSMFDPEHGGQMICGQASSHLPRIRLEYDAKTDTVHAVGVEGLLYGRQSNLL